MKTIEEKAKAYDEIIERAKTMLAAGEVMYGKENNASQLITDLIPELRESEDERIRKRAVAILKQQRDFWSYGGPSEKFPPSTPRKDLVEAIDIALSYLERQKENSLSLVDAWKEMRTEVFAQASGNKPKPESDEFTKLFSLNDIDFLISDLDSRGIKPKPVEWSEEDEKMLDIILTDINYAQKNYSSSRLTPYDKKVSWLKSLRPQPQGVYKQIVHNILDMIDRYESLGYDVTSSKTCIPQIRAMCKTADECHEILDEPQLKPSEEQMKALKSAIEYLSINTSTPGNVLIQSLYEQLKML